MRGRRQFLAGALAGLGFSPATALTAGGDDRFRAVPKHLQVFRTPPSDWPAVVALCRDLGIGALAVAIAPDERRRLLADRAAAGRAFATLGNSGLRVRCMIGEGSWARYADGALPPNLLELLAVHDRLFRFEALLLDVEPQVLPEWKRGERASLVRGTLRFFDAVRAACRERGMKLSAALAPWYTRTPDPDRNGASFLDGCLERLDEALLMGYRNSPPAAIEFTREALDALARRPVPCWFGLTTQRNDAPGSSYYGLGMDRLKGDAVALYDALRAGQAERAIAGIAIHQYATLRSLAQAS